MKRATPTPYHKLFAVLTFIFSSSALLGQPFQGYEVSGVQIPVTSGWTSSTRTVYATFYTNSSGSGISKEVQLLFNSANIGNGDSIIVLSDTAGFKMRSLEQSTGWRDVISKSSISTNSGARQGFALSSGQSSLTFEFKQDRTTSMAASAANSKALVVWHKSASGTFNSQYLIIKVRIIAAANVYRWTGELSKDFHDEDNWIPARTSISASDKLIFDHIGSKECEIRNNGSKVNQTIDQIIVNHYTDVMFTNYRNNGDNSVSTLILEDQSTNLNFYNLQSSSDFGDRYIRGSGLGNYDFVYGIGAGISIAGTDTIAFKLTPNTYIQAASNSSNAFPFVETINDKGNGACLKLYLQNSTEPADLFYSNFNCEANTSILLDGDAGIEYSEFGAFSFTEPTDVRRKLGGAGRIVISPRVIFKQMNSDGAFPHYLGGTLEVYGTVIGNFISNSPSANTEAAWNSWSPYLKIMNDGVQKGRIGPQLVFGTSTINITGGVEWQMYNSGNRAWRTVGFPFTAMHVSQISRNIVITGTKDATNKDSFYSFNSTCAHCKTSLYAWDESNSAWSGFESGSTANKIDAGEGVLLFFRGLGDAGLGDASASATAGVMTFKGSPVLGDKTIDLTYNSNGGSLKGVNLVANPYMSNVDWNALTRTNVADKFYFYDPAGKMYNTYDNTGSSVVVSGTNAYKAGSALETRTIEQGAAFFAIATGSSATLKFQEADKIATQGSASAFREEREFPCNRLAMTMLSSDPLKKEMDHATLEWDMSEKGASHDGDFMDMPKIYGGYYGIGTVDSKGEWYVIDRRPDLKNDRSETVNMKIASHEKNGSYKIQFEMCMDAPTAEVFLVDRLKGKKVAVNNGSEFEFTQLETDALKGDRFALELNKVDAQNSIESLSNKLSVYPNPVHGESKIFIASSEGIQLISANLRDIQGKLIQTWKLGSLNTLELHEQIPTGMYVLEISTNEGISKTKIAISNP